MSFLPNVFSDPVLRQRQDELDAIWKSLNGLQNKCDNMPDTSWVEFVNDFKRWQDFYDSETDWSSDAKKATDEWQRKAKSWSDRLKSYGCRGTLGTEAIVSPEGDYQGSTTIYAPGDGGIPGVKDPPPDEKGLVDRIGDAFSTVGWVATALTLMVIVGLFVLLFALVRKWSGDV